MRQGRGLLFGVLAACLAGCLTGQSVQTTAFLDRFRTGDGPPAPDLIHMEVAILEVPPGDHYANQELWAQADDQVLPLDQKVLLEDNGFRVGQVGGMPPPGLQALLTSERSCSARHIQLHANHSTPVPIGEVHSTCQFTLISDGRVTAVDLPEGQCQLVIVPTLASEGRTRLHFTPEVRSGKPSPSFRPMDDRSGWMLGEMKPTKQYPTLAWDVTLELNEYVIVGGRFDQPGTLGHVCFMPGEEPTPRQRLLAIRTGRPAVGVAAEREEASRSDKSPPIALQAAWPTARGKSN